MVFFGGNGGVVDNYVGIVFENGGGICIEVGMVFYIGLFELEGDGGGVCEGDCIMNNVFVIVFVGE